VKEATPPGLRIGVLTVSDACSRGERENRSGRALEEWCSSQGHSPILRLVVPDETDAIVPVLVSWADGGTVDLILTTGGTGFGPRDVTPEATRAVLDREAPGLQEKIRRAGESKTPFSTLSRGLAGTRGSVLIVNLPGSPGGVRDGLEVLESLISHMVGLLKENDTPHQQS
jgi:molybdenum cofactor synthesis domain-containing protein